METTYYFQHSLYFWTIFSFYLLLSIGVGSSSSSSSSHNKNHNNSNSSINTKSETTSTKVDIASSTKPFRCYTCSWSEMANTVPNGTSKNVDVCSSYKFVPEAAATVPCDYGCQTVSYKINKKDQFSRHFHRNCLKKEPDEELADKCVINYSKAFGFEQVCDCLTNLCNVGVSQKMSQFTNTIILFGVFLIIVQFSSRWWMEL